MSLFEEFDERYQEAIDTLDVKYVDDDAFMSVHTVDAINHSLMTVMEIALEAQEETGEEIISDDMIQGAVWVMGVWKQLHDELVLRSEIKSIPDTVPDDLKE